MEEHLNTAPSSVEEKEARQLALQSAEYAQVKARNLAFMDMTRFKTMEVMAQTFINSGAMPSGWNAHKCIVAFQAAYERGMYPVEAVNSFAFINGKITLYGDIVIARVLNAGHKIQWGIYTDENGVVQKMPCSATQASVTITRGDNGETLSAHMTMEDAQARKLNWDNKNGCIKAPWVAAPDNMLKFKVFTMVQRFLVPDATMNMPVKEEVEADMTIEATEIVPKQTISADGNKPLEETLAVVEEEKPADEPKKTKGRAKKEKVVEVEATVTEEPQGIEHDDDRYTRLVQEELSGKTLSDEDKKWLNSRTTA